MNRILKGLAVGGLALGLSAPALAIPIAGVNDPANNTAEFGYSVSPWVLSVSLENTSNYDARITGFGFDLYHGLTLGLFSVSGTLDDGDWSFAFDAIPGGGDRDAFAITGNNLWGGDPNSGIAVGNTGLFNFVGLFGEHAKIDNVLVRFQRTGADGEGSDKGIACVRDCTPPTTVPEPGPLSLLGMGLLMIGLIHRRRTRHAP